MGNATSRLLQDVAYGCFLYCGLLALALAALPLFGYSAAMFLFFLLAVPAAAAAMVVMPAGILVSLLVRSWPLLALSALSTVVLLMIFSDFLYAFYWYNEYFFLAVYGGASLVLCGRWFTSLRRR